ncbi:hypothetical protein CMUS01_06329 [Colletotrichum musicola]|uniref:Uncharacterized protein n=1 Tax=Colletotrichum musicola TaxID=2175873 RepID=A0A8H6KML0_9PEZI|nr:hypothetical protein CMUS01_06329 [Colletotrichum musicola]
MPPGGKSPSGGKTPSVGKMPSGGGEDNVRVYDDFIEKDFEQYRPNQQLNKGAHITLTVLESLSGGSQEGQQVLLCKTPLLSRQLPLPIVVNRVVVKIFDPMFYSWVYNPVGPPWNEATLAADLAFTREAAAYDKFQEKGLLGKPHLAPGYLGAFTVQLKMFNPQVRVEQRTRYVGAIILEYVEGHRMSDLCDIDVEVYLIPKMPLDFCDGLR